MRIANIKIRNFRKLKEVSVDLQADKTVFIGANNSGKTSAMIAMRCFLNLNGLNINDFTLSNHKTINEIGKNWEKEAESEVLNVSSWNGILPSFDIWFDVGDDDIQYVCHILPTLDWVGGNLGVRLQYEPKNIEDFYGKYKEARIHAERLKENKQVSVDLFPKDMVDFLKRDLKKYFSMKYYVLDPAKKDGIQNFLGEPLEGNPLLGLIQVDEINAQRGLDDEVTGTSPREPRCLSKQLVEYYKQYLDLSEDPTEHDVEALNAIHQAQQTFTEGMRRGFQPALKELGTLGYPGFHDPNITINPQLKPTDGFNHSSALEYELDGHKDSFLPETYNGLGYQNLIFIAFKLIQFRDSRLKGEQKTFLTNDTHIKYPPIHLILVEEPEAHLHPQAQQVFINQAYEILKNDEKIKQGSLVTQLVVSTHSSHITHECEFANLRYFKRVQPTDEGVPSSEIINLSNVFGKNNEDTERFVTRYIKLTHCDLFFADAAILIEGDAERILLPHFLHRFPCLNLSYICQLSIGGSHAHRLEPLMKILEIPTLIITDLDAVGVDRKSVRVERKKKQKTSNPTLKNWIPQKETIDELLELSADEKIQDIHFPLRVAFQTPIIFGDSEIPPHTFEESLIFDNQSFFDCLQAETAMLKRVKDITDAKQAFETIRDKGFKKAEFAMELLCLSSFSDIKVPAYISEGLQWLDNVLQSKLKRSTSVQNNKEVKNEK